MTKAVLFDLDGTLVDSRADLAAGVNLLLDELGLPPLDLPTILQFVGRGARSLIRRSLERVDPEETVPRTDDVLRRFLGHYRRVMLDETAPFPGVESGLARLHAAGVPLGVVTNKPHGPAVEILEALDLSHWMGVILGSGAVPARKPAPDGLLVAAGKLGVRPAFCSYVGDSDVDVLAARAAGMRSLWCSWGGIHPDQPEELDERVDSFDTVVQLALAT